MGQSALPHDPVFVAGHFGWECLGLVAGIEKPLVPACDRDGTCLPDIFRTMVRESIYSLWTAITICTHGGVHRRILGRDLLLGIMA